MNPVATFAVRAEAFRRWLIDGPDTGAPAARQALAHLAALVAAALDLPTSEDIGGEPVEVSTREWEQAFEASRRLPVRHYGDVFEPLTLPTEGLGVGDVADDLADIYRDLLSGLRACDSGDRAGAVWQWRSSFWTHWGRHATGAARALFVWLASSGEG